MCNQADASRKSYLTVIRCMSDRWRPTHSAIQCFLVQSAARKIVMTEANGPQHLVTCEQKSIFRQSMRHENRSSLFHQNDIFSFAAQKVFFFSRQNCDFIAVNLLPKLNFLFKFAFSKANEAKVLRTKREKKNAEFLCLFWKSILLRFPQASWQEDEKNCSVSQWQ